MARRTRNPSGSVKLTPGRGKLRGRTCVVVETGKRAPGFKGRGSTKRFMGCFKSRADAARRATQLGR